jgi:hypothetical protein
MTMWRRRRPTQGCGANKKRWFREGSFHDLTDGARIETFRKIVSF